MIAYETGSYLLGFTNKMKCFHCSNETPMHIRQVYLKQSVFFVPTVSRLAEVDMVCPICEKKERLITSTLWGSDEKVQRIKDLLNGGKEITKSWFKEISPKEQEGVMKRLNKIKAYDLVKFLAS